MDYQSFQPNPPAPKMLQQMPPVLKNFTSKFVGVVAGLLVLSGVASAGLWFWNDKNVEVVVPTFTPWVIDETAGWQTYRNEQYGLEFKYPVKEKLTITPLQQLGDNLFEVEIGDYSDGPYSLFSTVSINKKSVEDFIKELKQNSEIEDVEVTQETHNSIKWSVVTYTHFPRGYRMAVTSFSDHNFYINDSFFEILSTFKFVERPEPTVCIQVITPARNLQTGEVRDFPTPCDVPEGWSRLSP